MIRAVRLLLLATALLTAGGFAIWQTERLHAAISGASGPPPRPGQGEAGGTEISVVTPETTAIVPVSTIYGQVEAPLRVEVTPATSGHIISAMDTLRDGAQVAAGDVLVRIDDTEADLALREAQADLASAETTLAERERKILEAGIELDFQRELLELKEADIERTTALIEKGTYSQTLLETSRAALVAARQFESQGTAALAASEDLASQGRIALELASLAVERAERTLADHSVIAPISGTFSGDTPIMGQQLSESEIGTITDMGSLEIRLDLTQAALTRMTGPDGRILPLAITATRPGMGASATGVLDRLTIADASDDTDQTFAIARIINSGDARLRPGDFVEVRVTEPAIENLLSLPASAVLPGDEVLAVRDGVLERLPVAVFRRQDETVVLASNDLAERDIVLLPSGEMEDGMQVLSEAGQAGQAEDVSRAQSHPARVEPAAGEE